MKKANKCILDKSTFRKKKEKIQKIGFNKNSLKIESRKKELIY